MYSYFLYIRSMWRSSKYVEMSVSLLFTEKIVWSLYLITIQKHNSYFYSLSIRFNFTFWTELILFSQKHSADLITILELQFFNSPQLNIYYISLSWLSKLKSEICLICACLTKCCLSLIYGHYWSRPTTLHFLFLVITYIL